MSAVGQVDGVKARREYVMGLFTEYLEEALSPELRFTVENALDQDPILSAHFDSFQQAIALARAAMSRHGPSESQLQKLLTFLRDNIRKT